MLCSIVFGGYVCMREKLAEISVYMLPRTSRNVFSLHMEWSEGLNPEQGQKAPQTTTVLKLSRSMSDQCLDG